jgi:hypothetical protein
MPRHIAQRERIKVREYGVGKRTSGPGMAERIIAGLNGRILGTSEPLSP